MPSPKADPSHLESRPELPAGYAPVLEELKERIRTAQLRAAVSVNRELVLLYWNLGCQILAAQEEQGWGAKVVQRLSADLSATFPEMKGHSRTNLLYMRAFAEAWPDEAVVQQPVGQIPWGRQCVRSSCSRLLHKSLGSIAV